MTYVQIFQLGCTHRNWLVRIKQISYAMETPDCVVFDECSIEKELQIMVFASLRSDEHFED
ncbi:hypothetical protein RB10754 [Rhodopirellula baltica SH 1]|uniref:Uncharacterized protein n=1 Tax=Rhodopirellula baltica (strain DSM 10527 / NCIMB 13988 / SH1) TaxID=243090 RepID=Q7UKA5_RHOBA|nr:hypothetical protein RB10754 [Rhodopirellula baltica SH 1]